MEIEVNNGVLIRKHTTPHAKANIWFIHAFGDSGLCFNEAFDSPLNAHYNIYVPDLPGFGASPFNSKYRSIKDYALLLREVIRSFENDLTVVVAHSVSGLIGTWLCDMLKTENIAFVNVEGNLTSADNYFTGKAKLYDSASEFFSAFSREIHELSVQHKRFRRYFSSVQFADPQALMMMGRTACDFAEGNQCGYEFKNLACKKVYVYGDLDTSPATMDFITQNQIPVKFFKGIGHWHMIENSREFYDHVRHFIGSG